MAGYRLAEEYIPKFMCFLQEKGIIKDYKIKKDVARTIYMEEFKLVNNIKGFSFSKMFSFMRFFGVMKYDKKTDRMTFQADVLNNITPETNLVKRKKFKIAPLLQAQQNSHVDSKPAVNKPSVSSKSSSQNKKPSNVRDCKVCQLRCNSVEVFEQHQNTDGHKRRMKYFAKTKAESNLLEPLFAEVIEGHGGGVENVIVRLNQPSDILLKLINNTSQDYTIMKIIEIVKIKKPASVVNLPSIVLPYLLPAQSQLCVNISMFFSENIFWTYPLIFYLTKNKTGEEIEVLKELEIHVYSPLVDDLRPAEPYKKPPKPIFNDTDDEIIRGEHPDNKDTDFKPKFYLPKYNLPDNIIVLLNEDLKKFKGMTFQQSNTLRDVKNLLIDYEKTGTLNKKNYFKILELSLMMEEHQMRIDIRKYDTNNQELIRPRDPQSRKSNCLELDVPGLAEHRPSLLRGDSVMVKESKESNTKYEGIVHKVNQNSVILGFSRKFVTNVHVDKKKYHVSFTFNRVTLRAEHQAIEFVKAHNVINLLCSEKIQTRQLKSHQIVWHNPNLLNNIKQQQAVRYILSGTSFPMPYLIFGPPGTGKTVTIVEAILQIWKIKPKDKILVCAPSNSAANEITKRLVKFVPQRDLFRYIAPSFPPTSINEEIKPFTNYLGEYYHPSITKLLTYRIVITTLVTASRLVNGGTPLNHFSYVFIDESGQATESETLIPIAGILTSAEKLATINGQIVLAGDPKQLGPIIHSNRAEKCGFGVSMLERLMKYNPIYQKNNNNQYDDAMLTKLVKSYRSHPAILNLPNKLFYDGELVPAGEMISTHIAENWEELPNKKFPVIFHSVVGKDERELNSPRNMFWGELPEMTSSHFIASQMLPDKLPAITMSYSFFNLQEVDVVVNYLDKLIGHRLSGIKIMQKHIGVIAPYRKQVQKLERACKKKQWHTLNIGSVEQFQGQERLIIIVSTVRAKPEFMKHDEQFHLGFLKNPKRFNVAITRAKALLIVVGNPNILQYDPHWHAFIKYCKDNRACIGTPFTLSETYQNSELDSIPTNSSLVNGNAAGVEDGPNFSRGRS